MLKTFERAELRVKYDAVKELASPCLKWSFTATYLTLLERCVLQPAAIQPPPQQVVLWCCCTSL